MRLSDGFRNLGEIAISNVKNTTQNPVTEKPRIIALQLGQQFDHRQPFITKKIPANPA